MDKLQAIFDRAKSHCRSPSDVAHLSEATECARWLCEREDGDPAIVLPAIMLHDVGWSGFTADEEAAARGSSIEARTANRRHEEEGAALARRILEETEVDPDLIDVIVDIVLWHDTRSEALSRDEAIVKDANLLSRFTPRGFEATCARFQVSEAELLERLQGSIDTMFSTSAARLMARLHLSKRRLRSVRTTARDGGLLDRLVAIFLELGDRVVLKARKSLEEIAMEGLRQRLADIKLQFRLYLEGHPAATLSELQENPEFHALATQPIFTEGYAGVIDIGRDSPRYGQIIFHPDPRLVNQPLERLEEQRPIDVAHTFWDWYRRAVAGEEFSAYYRSKDRTDMTREKMLCAAPLRVGAHEWSVVASTIVTQSFQHADALSEEISGSVDAVLDELDANLLLPLTQLISGSEVIAGGDLSHRIRIDADNELGLLGAAFNDMVASIERSVELIRQQQASIAELSVPVIRVWKGVLVLPLIGVVDEDRGRRITETILPRVVEERAGHVFIDLTGVSVTGPEVIHTLLRITRAIGLLGAACTITGISPRIAGALVESDLELSGVRTAMNLEQGLRQVLRVSAAR